MLEEAIEKHGLEKVQARAVEKLAALQVSEERMLESMGRKVRAAITIEDLITLHGAIEALKIGAETIDELFPVKAPPAPAPSGKSRTEQLAEELMGEAAPSPAATPTKPIADDVKAQKEKLDQLRENAAAQAPGSPPLSPSVEGAGGTALFDGGSPKAARTRKV